MPFLRIIEKKSDVLDRIAASPETDDKDNQALVEGCAWKKNAVDYLDYIQKDTAFRDRPEILFAAILNDDGSYVVVKDTGAFPDMPHTFAGWPWMEGGRVVIRPSATPPDDKI